MVKNIQLKQLFLALSYNLPLVNHQYEKNMVNIIKLICISLALSLQS